MTVHNGVTEMIKENSEIINAISIFRFFLFFEKIKRSITIIAIIEQIPTVIIYFAVLSSLAFCNESIPSKLLTIISCLKYLLD